MASKENIYFLRSFLLLIEGGLYISKEILSRECQKSENDLDELLKINERKLKHLFHDKQYKKLYPEFGKADINSWDLQLSVGVLINVFGRHLKLVEKEKLRTLRDIRNDIYMHCTTAALDEKEYEDVKEQLDDIITTLASTFDISVQQRCSNYIKQFTSEQLDAVRPSLHTLNGFSQSCQKKLKVGVETELVIGGPSANWISLCEHTLESIFNHAESMASEDGGFQEIEENVKTMLSYLESNKDVVFKGCKRKCIIMFFECDDYDSFLNFLDKVESQEYTCYLRDLSNSLHSFFKPKNPTSITSKVTSESLQSVMIDIIKTFTNEEEERRHVFKVSSDDNFHENKAIATASHGVNKGKQLTNQSETSLSLNLELQSEEALPQMLQSFQGKEFSDSLKNVADSISRYYGGEITLKASMDVGALLEALEDSVSSAVTVAQETKTTESIYAMTSKDDLHSLSVIDDVLENDTVPIDSNVLQNIGVKGVKIVAFRKVYDCRNVYTMQGDMTELTVDMIVNRADDKLSLTGGLGKAIVKKGGKGIQKECADYIRDNDLLDDGEAFVSTAGSLKASAIVHVRGPDWRGDMKQEDEMLKDSVFKCLQQASTRNLTSIAIPDLSCYGYSVRKATTIIVAAVKNFFRKVQESTVTDIYLCDMKTNTVEAFNEALSNEFGASNVKKYVDNLDSIRQPSKRFSRADTDDDETYIKPIDTDEEDDVYYISHLAPPSGKVPPLQKGRPPQKTTKIGNISISVVKGEIAKQKVDVIVNSTANNLDLKNGPVSASLLKTGGKELQQEVSKKYPNGIKGGEIAVTSGQSLKCDIVVHCSLANWDRKEDAQCIQALHKLMKDCMDEAENQGKTSIAFPAIGTGNLGFPRDIVATEMFSAVSKFSISNPSSSLREVSFIVYQKDFQTIQAFEDEARRWSTGKRGATGGREGRQYDLYQDLQEKESKQEVETILSKRQEIKTKQEEYRHAKTKAQERHSREVFNPFELKGQNIKTLELLEPTLEQDKYKLPITKETIEESVATAVAIPNELDKTTDSGTASEDSELNSSLNSRFDELITYR